MGELKTLYSQIDDGSIKALVDHFYGKILDDNLVGPLFKSRIGNSLDQWAEHLTKMYRFWASVMNGTGQYKGNPPSNSQPVCARNPNRVF